jgi:hypothetical protein
LHTYKNNNSLFFVLINPKKNSLNAWKLNEEPNKNCNAVNTNKFIQF